MKELFVERRLGFGAYEGVADLFGVCFNEFGEFLTEAEQASGAIGTSSVNVRNGLREKVEVIRT